MKNLRISLIAMFLAVFFVGILPETAQAQKRHNKKVNQKRTAKKSNRNFRRTPAKVAVTSPRRAKVVAAPRGARTIAFAGVNYRYHNGAFYRPYNNSFIVTRPPIGLRVAVIPPSYQTIWLQNRRYYYFDGIYYNRLTDNYYEVIDAPIGARVSQLPPYSETAYLDGNEYYISEGIYYKVIQSVDGRLEYEVVGYS